ncbi:ubiquitin-like-conjugating enzyme ATG10 [Copidosoma floridanum]|uniref:ubiquitin-like-conjugating enzyme ATG10 n=1 Tax=Copidosoma floridanum TaxID=29053 RepID=UPI0006C9B659|nr:ubiquitin-like-conjugating enzyme ATG10 [Copidosoma floridanum]XP_014210702.1 ubiquitin-like-conjugating enzyme ATG10 [Copidosoma floridanum]XP_014210703.1 ubiquitin-like-conjugating enzyme ATG10 [Copidosoma floridanum]
MDGPGTMTWEEFVDNAEKLVRLSDEISDHWKFPGDKALPGQAYLTRQEKLFVPIDHPMDDERLEDGLNIECDDEKWCEELNEHRDPYEYPVVKERPLIIEHHVLWSMSYSVPVIYFNGWKSDYPGINPVSVEIAQKLLETDKLAYNELSQAIHPLLGRPFLHLHPCGSPELLRSVAQSTNKLVSWLSAVAPAALKLRLRSEYFYLTNAARGGDKDNAEDGR